MRGRLSDGTWKPNFDPVEWGGEFTEANAWQYTWSVMHNVSDLIELMGGEEKFNSKLDSFFTMPQDIKYGTYGKEIHEMREMLLAKMGQYAHGNQPTQHVPYLYNYSGKPWKAQQKVREVTSKLYNSSEKGYPGDEDQGQMSSWYVLSALGFYSVCPGTDQYVFGSPVFNKATIELENGEKFVIEAVGNNRNNVYIESATLNGLDYQKNYINYGDIIKGGKLKFIMSDSPNKDRGTKPEDRPFSLGFNSYVQ